MTTRTAVKLRDELIGAARQIGGEWTVREVAGKMPGSWPSSTLDRELGRLADEGLITLVRTHPQRQFRLGAPADDPAPDWSNHYPSGGELIGPTWQAMWSTMADGAWHDVRELLQVGQRARGAAEKTVRNQLFSAAAARHIEPEARRDEQTGRWRIWYRRPDKAVS